MSALKLYESPEWREDMDQEGGFEPLPVHETSDQITDAILALDRPEGMYLRWPWVALDGMTGGMAPGDVWFIVAGSSIGKTTLVTSAIDLWRREQRKVMVLPLETRAHTFRTILACQQLDIAPGFVLSGDFKREANWRDVRGQIKDELLRQASDPAWGNLRVKGVPFINAARFELAVQEAVDMGATVMVVDHIDHIEGGDGTDLFAESQRVVKQAMAAAQKYQMLVLFTSQTNLGASHGTGDYLAQYQPPRPNHVYMGNHKRMVATGMIGIFRPVRRQRPDETMEEYTAQLKRCRNGDDPAWMALEPGVMGINQMKSRNGKPEGARCYLKVEHGRVVDLPERDQYATTRQNIRTKEPQR